MVHPSVHGRSLLQLATIKRPISDRQILVSWNLFLDKLALIGKVHGAVIKWHAKCDKCEKLVSPYEVYSQMNFSESSGSNLVCRSNKCGGEIVAGLVVGESTQPFSLMSPFNILSQLSGKEGLPPSVVETIHPELYYNCLVCFGSMFASFKLAGVLYEFTECSKSTLDTLKTYLWNLSVRFPTSWIEDVLGYSYSGLKYLISLQKLSAWKLKSIPFPAPSIKV